MTITPPEPASQPVASAQPVPPPPVAENPYAPQYTYVNQVQFAPAPPRGLSITAMVLGILGLVGSFVGGGFLSIGAVIFGHVGLRKEPSGRGMAIAGLVTGYIGVGLGLVFLIIVIGSIVTAVMIGSVAVGTAGLNS